jgi:NADP-dependent 3-hydroxy acid dehydrogenase YdfG
MAAAQIFDLRGKVALVTGASVVLVARRGNRLAVVKARIGQSGNRPRCWLTRMEPLPDRLI